MSGTYVAWNGQSYPWPPPEGWYEGSDGRWWAPGSGPEPDRSAALQSEEESSSEQQTIITKPTERPLPSHADAVAAANVDNQSAGGETNGTGAHDQDRDSISKPADSKRSSNTVVLLAGAVTLLLIGAGLVALLNRGGGSGTTASGSAAPSTTLAAGEPTNQASTTQPANSQDSDATPPSTTQPPQTSTTEGEPTTTTADAADASLAAAWRETLADRGIDTTELSDEDIIDFGKSFCVFAVVSTDAEEFDTYRDRAQTGVAGSLTEAQLTAAIDSAVVTFCPEDAERLDITL